MTFDDGFGANQTTEEAFGPRILYALDKRGWTFHQLCQAAGLEEHVAVEAIQRGTYGLPKTEVVLNQLLAPLNLHVDWLLGSVAVTEFPWDVVEKLVWEYIYKARVPKSHRQMLLNECRRRHYGRQVSTAVKAARPGSPRTWRDIAYIYHALLREEN